MIKKKEIIKSVSLKRLRARITVPSIDDDILMFTDLKMFPQLQEPRRMNCLFVGVCTKGDGQYSINQKAQHVKAGEALILTEGQVVDSIIMSDDCEGMGLLISYSFLNEIVKDVENISTLFLLARRHPVFKLTPGEVESTLEYAAMIEKRIKGNNYRFRKDVVRMLILTMIYDLGNAFYRILGRSNNDYTTRAEQLFIEFIHLVERNFIDQRRVRWYAEKMGITPKYLSETVRMVSQRTPNDWIERYVTMEIKNQLRKTNKKISEIAEYMHFTNQSFLGKYFKDNVGISPSDYRKNGHEE